MMRKLTDLLRLVERGIADQSHPAPANAELNESEQQPAAIIPVEPAPSQDDTSPPPPFWMRLLSAERKRLNWLLSHRYVPAIAVGLAVVIVVAEQWLIQAWSWLVALVRLYWPALASHRVALIGVGLILLYLIIGLQWLRAIDDLGRWVVGVIKRHPRLSALIGGILLLIVLWTANNYGTWVVLPFTVGQSEATQLNGETVAAQLIAELNQVGVGNPTPVLVLLELQEPRTSRGRVTARRSLPLEECDTVLLGPGDFIASRRIPLPRVVTGSQGSRLDLGNLSIGTISIPSQLFTQSLLKVLPTGYVEFSGQISENNGELEISVSSRSPSFAWRAAGPSDTFPEMVEYLALRMALDLNPELIKASRLDAPPSDRDLAFAMGNQAFRQQLYQRAQAFYKLADQFASLDEKVDAMLGLTYYHLASRPAGLALDQPGGAPDQFAPAVQAMETAVREDPNGDSSLLRPYLACLYYKASLTDQAEVQRNIFTQYLLRLESQDFEVRVDALKQLPLRGPSQHLSAADGNVIYVDGTGTIKGAAGRPLDTGLSLSSQNPRQIQTYGDANLLFISADGAVLTYNYQAAAAGQVPTTLVEGRTLSGVQQISTSDSQFGRTNLFLLNRFGIIFWCDLDAGIGGASACPPRQALVDSFTNVRQILPSGDRLYILASDGAVWYTEVNVNGQAAFAPRQLTPPAPAQEISVASDSTIYLLHDNGNVWRYYDDGRPESEDLRLIDPGTGTAQIFAAGNFLYVLKNNGATWRISNPRDPISGNDFTEISAPPQDVTIQEMFVTTPIGDQAASGSRSLYLLTAQGMLLQGTDAGDMRVTFTPVNMPTPAQTSATQ